jgi:hypothetical protein
LRQPDELTEIFVKLASPDWTATGEIVEP